MAAIVYASDSVPLEWWIFSAAWLALLALLSFLMVSTWRYPSFKEISFTGPRSPLTVILFGALIYLIWNYSQPVLLAISTLYVGTGIADSRRRYHPPPIPSASPAAPAGASGHLACTRIAARQRPTLAIVGGETLLGKEVRELLEASRLR